MIHFTRRSTLAAAAAGFLMAPGLRAQAAAPSGNRQAPGFHRTKVGRFEVTALLDGMLALPWAAFTGAEEAPALLARYNQRPGPQLGPVTAYTVNTGDRLYLVDCGFDVSYNRDCGKLPEAMAEAGMRPEQVDAILVTHLHPDHVGGAVRDGRAIFPNAEMIVSDVDAAYYLAPDALSRAPAAARPLFQVAQAAAGAYANRLRLIDVNAQVAPGIRAVPLPGHTPGQIGYLIADGGESLLIWADVMHAPLFQFSRPNIGIVFDVDRGTAIATRLATLDRVATDGTMVAGTHHFFPGIGHVGRDGAGYAYNPILFRPF